MLEAPVSQLKQAVESQHGGTATFVQSTPVREQFGGETAFSGNVAIFDLKNSPSGATRAYAWEQDRPDGKKRYAAVLHLGGITGPVEAVRAAIVAEQKQINECPSCGGTGVMMEMHTVSGFAAKPPTRECPACHGTGSRSRIGL